MTHQKSGVTTTNEFDSLTGRLSHVLTKTNGVTAMHIYYTYDAAGIIVSNSRGGTTTCATTKPHAVRQADSITRMYGENGNHDHRTDGNNVLTDFEFNADNHLSSITRNNVTVSFIYDHQGNRVKKTFGRSTTVTIGSLYECTGGART